MHRLRNIKGMTFLSGVALGAVLLTIGIALAQGVITRDQPALVTVIGQLSVHETLVLYPDLNGQPDLANPLGPNEALNFGDVELDAFGNVAAGSPRIPLYVLNNAGFEITLTVKASGDGPQPMIEALFGPRGGEIGPAPENATNIGIGRIFTADLGIRFIGSPGTGDHNFVVNFMAEAEDAQSPAGPSRIAFASDRSGNYQIYTMNPDGTDQVRITSVNMDNSGTDQVGPTNLISGDRMPDWSPDGTRVAFIATADGESDLYIMDADGSNRTQLTSDNLVDRSPDWSPDGNLIALEHDWGDIWTIKPDGTDLTYIGRGRGPDWSLDGTRILFYKYEQFGENAGWDIYIMDADGSNVVDFTVSGPSRWPAWSPDGSRVAYQTGKDFNLHSGAFEIYVKNADGTNKVRLTNHTAVDRYPSWSPDGNRIVFTSDRDGIAQLYVMDAVDSDGDGNGDNLTPLSNNQSNDV